MRISDWSSDVCSSDLQRVDPPLGAERLARHRRQIVELQQRLVLDQRIAGKLAFQFLAPGEIADLPHAMDEHDLVEALIDFGIAREAQEGRSEERRVGKGCVSKCRSRWSPYP